MLQASQQDLLQSQAAGLEACQGPPPALNYPAGAAAAPRGSTYPPPAPIQDSSHQSQCGVSTPPSNAPDVSWRLAPLLSSNTIHLEGAGEAAGEGLWLSAVLLAGGSQDLLPGFDPFAGAAHRCAQPGGRDARSGERGQSLQALPASRSPQASPAHQPKSPRNPVLWAPMGLITQARLTISWALATGSTSSFFPSPEEGQKEG